MLSSTGNVMNKLTEQEFEDKLNDIAWAREIFIKSGMTRNITEAYEAYCKVFDKQVEIMNTKEQGARIRTALDSFERPTCPYCNKSKMAFRPVPPNQAIKVQLLCEDPKCDTCLNSFDDMSVWIKRLQNGELEVSTLSRVSKRAPIPGRRYTWLKTNCPKCSGRLYEIAVCCGAPEGLVECSECDFQELPSKFHKR